MSPIAKLQTTQMSIAQVGNRTTFLGLTNIQVGQFVRNFADGLTGAFTRFGEAIAEGTNGFKAIGTAFLEFAGELLT